MYQQDTKNNLTSPGLTMNQPLPLHVESNCLGNGFKTNLSYPGKWGEGIDDVCSINAPHPLCTCFYKLWLSLTLCNRSLCEKKLSTTCYHCLKSPGGASGKDPTPYAEDLREVGSIPGWGRSPGEANGNPLQYSCLENPMDRGAWWAIVRRGTKGWTWLRWPSTHTHITKLKLYTLIM